jgi:hypothetical protein
MTQQRAEENLNRESVSCDDYDYYPRFPFLTPRFQLPYRPDDRSLQGIGRGGHPKIAPEIRRSVD